MKLKIRFFKRELTMVELLNKQEKLLKGKPSDECEDIKRSLDDVLKLDL